MSTGARDGVPALRAEAIRKTYGSHEVLCGIDLDVERGEVVTVIGPSGSGKSTLLRCLNLIEVPTSGRVWIGDDEITAPKARVNAIRSRVGMVFQSFNLFPHRSVVDNVALAPMTVRGRDGARARDEARELLRKVGLADRPTRRRDPCPAGSSSGSPSPAPWRWSPR